MKIQFDRFGGALGIPRKVEVDTEQMSADEAAEIHGLVEASEFFGLPASLTQEGQAPDRFSYQIMIEDGAKQHAVNTDELGAPDTLRPLIERLENLLRTQRRSSDD
jgi:hypothetical protein